MRVLVTDSLKFTPSSAEELRLSRKYQENTKNY